jgi:23S rRNA (uracil1939-C5)-methyltransferase
MPLKQAEVRFDRMDASGMAVGRSDAGEVAAFGAFPGERAAVELVRRKGGLRIGRVREILEAIPERIPPAETHYLSCSPWQGIRYPAQIEYKKKILQELFQQAAGEPVRPDGFFDSAEIFGYRNKLEFSFAAMEGRLRLAFFERWSHSRKLPLEEGCRLGTARMNAAALAILERLAQRGIEPQTLKSLVIRESRSNGDVFAALFVRDRAVAAADLAGQECSGFLIAWSDPRTPAAVVSEVLVEQGRPTLTEKILDLEIEYPALGFFQNHVVLFERALEEIRASVPQCEKVVELYCGAGIIGLAVAGRARRVAGVESDAASAACARRNAERHGAGKFEILEGRAEQASPEILAGADVMILDPPRSGLHPKLIGKILAARPARIVYLSCHPARQAGEFAQLRECYRPVRLLGFDFYPQTPHLESLLVLERLGR